LDLQNPSLFRATNISKVQPLARGGEKKTT